MAREWTKQQENAINARNGSILVSAAAGSGKTAVLVERVIKRITDESKPCPANSLLIVTFTKAAASEMRERIAAALEECIRNNPDNSYLLEQQMLLPDAQICTIDSFCNSLVKENFHMLNISPDFQMIDASQQSILVSQAIESIMEKKYGENDEVFNRLVETLFTGRDDGELANCIVQLYNYSTAYPFPEKWLDSIAELYDPNDKISENCWGKKLIRYILSAIDYCLGLVEEMRTISSEDEDFLKSYENVCASDSAKLLTAKEKLEKGDWDGAIITLSESFARITNPRGRKDEPIAVALKEKRELIKSTVDKRILKYMCVSEEENRSDLEYLTPIVRKLVECTKDFSQELFRLKQESNTYDFADISQMALSLLVEEKDNEIVRTEFAAELSERYEEILIDEYQDTNKQQDMFFEALSKNKTNLFKVGDVKQSIYSFRQAMPEIFIELRSSLEEYRDNNYPSKIILDKNFRSRKEVTEYINFIFSQIMSEEVCKINYDEQEALVPGATYYAVTDIPKAHLHLIDTASEKLDGIDNILCQAKHIASLIKGMVSEKRPINDKNGLRPVKYKDICILLRSVKNKGTVFADEFRKWGIPCYTEVSGNFFSSTEIAVMLSLLRVIDNPAQDIPLLSVLHSPIFSFTADEVAKLRIANRGGSLYSCLITAENTNKKVAAFLLFFRKMRYIASTSTASDLIRRIYEETSYLAICRAMSDGEIRRANLMLLVDYAVTYEKSGYIGISGFIRFIDKLALNQKELDASNPVSENADVVRIMTIHKSKGLEFPVCILANADKNFNTEDEKKNMVINSELGVGLIRRDIDTLAEYETLSHSTSKLLRNAASKEEEMRILYVALTRAKEDLFVVGSVKNFEKTVKKLAVDMDFSKYRINPFSISLRNSYSDWIIKSAFRHPDCRHLRESIGIGEDYVIKSDFSLDLQIINEVKSPVKEHGPVISESRIDENYQQLIASRVEYEYKYSDLKGIPTKTTASRMDKGALDREHFASSKPAFLEGETALTAAQKGTATHKIMQYADYIMAAENLECEIQRLVSRHILTEQEAECVDRDKIRHFLDSELVERIKKSETVFREKKFTVDISVKEVYPEIEDDFGERIMIQGIIDCAFVENGKLVIVDYKTDRINDENKLIQMYKNQIETYKYAMETVTGYKVSKMYLYSFYMSKQVEIK